MEQFNFQDQGLVVTISKEDLIKILETAISGIKLVARDNALIEKYENTLKSLNQ